MVDIEGLGGAGRGVLCTLALQIMGDFRRTSALQSRATERGTNSRCLRTNGFVAPETSKQGQAGGQQEENRLLTTDEVRSMGESQSGCSRRGGHHRRNRGGLGWLEVTAFCCWQGRMRMCAFDGGGNRRRWGEPRTPRGRHNVVDHRRRPHGGSGGGGGGGLRQLVSRSSARVVATWR